MARLHQLCTQNPMVLEEVENVTVKIVRYSNFILTYSLAP